MTDNEIIKAVECCIKNNCDLCPFCEMDIYSCENELLAKIMSIIKRQQAEIERLKSNVFGMEFETAMYKAISESARAEAIKEFAENLKYDWFRGFNAYGIGAIHARIDAAVKEMVGAEQWLI